MELDDFWSWPDISNLTAKQQVARRVAEQVESGQTVGAGSGSTSYLAVLAIAARVQREDLHDVRFVPSSLEIQWALEAHGLAVARLDEVTLDWLFDGADAADPEGNLIKGRGGALLREKRLFSATQDRRILIDASKCVERLSGTVPVEVRPSLARHALRALAEVGGQEIHVRRGAGKDGPTITEAGNLLVDCRFAEVGPGLETELNTLPGVVESGIFWGGRPTLLLPEEA